MSEDLAAIITSLRAKRAELLTSVSSLDEAIAALSRVADAPDEPLSPRHDKVERSSDVAAKPAAGGQSVLRLAVALADEGPRSWSCNEIIEEYARRGTPLQVKDPQNAVFSAVARATKKGLLVRVDKGRYAAPEHAPGLSNRVEPAPAD